MYPHRDAGDYYRVRDRYHLVLRSPLGSFLRAGDQTVLMREGELWVFNNKIRHTAWNPARVPRIHLIFDLLPRPGGGYYVDLQQSVAAETGPRTFTAAANAWAAESIRTALSYASVRRAPRTRPGFDT